jgi:hypothetical protein
MLYSILRRSFSLNMRQVSTIEFKLIEKDVLFGLKQGNSVLTQLHAEMSLEDVEKLMSETADAVAYQQVSCVPLF